MYCNMQFCLRSVAATFDMFSVLKLSIINTTIESLEYRFKLSTFQSWLLVITVYAIFGHTQISFILKCLLFGRILMHQCLKTGVLIFWTSNTGLPFIIWIQISNLATHSHLWCTNLQEWEQFQPKFMDTRCIQYIELCVN